MLFDRDVLRAEAHEVLILAIRKNISGGIIKMKETSFYVYQLTYQGTLLYVGSGYKNRLDHVLSGCSHNRYLNTFVAYGYIQEDLSLLKTHENLNKEQSLALEKKLINDLKPIFNFVYSNIYDGEGLPEHYLEQHQFNRMLDVLKWGRSEPYISKYKKRISELENRLNEVIEENDRLKACLKNINTQRGNVAHGNYRTVSA